MRNNQALVLSNQVKINFTGKKLTHITSFCKQETRNKRKTLQSLLGWVFDLDTDVSEGCEVSRERRGRQGKDEICMILVR